MGFVLPSTTSYVVYKSSSTIKSKKYNKRNYSSVSRVQVGGSKISSWLSNRLLFQGKEINTTRKTTTKYWIITVSSQTALEEFVNCSGSKGVHESAGISRSKSKVLRNKGIERPVIIGVAADSGCGKSTFLRRVNEIFGTKVSQSHTPQGELVTVICLDDFHTLDRKGRAEKKVTALNPEANNFELMYQQIAALKEGYDIMKPIYNHQTGLIDPPELIQPNHIIVIEGLHPWYDARMKQLLDFTVYLDISDEVKVAWKIQRDMAERGHKLENILASIESRKPDFQQYIDPQKKDAVAVIQVLPTRLIPDDTEKKVLRVRLIQREGIQGFQSVYLYDEGSTIDWIPCGRKLTCSYPGIKFHYGPDNWYNHDVSVLEVDGNFEKLEELIYIESHLNNTSTKFYGEITQQLLRNSSAPGSNNGTGLFQVLTALKMRQLYEELTGKSIAPVLV
uniref:Phosphoribulokinase, chloroplastic n=1 Tax=Galdieria sulphuraria TaxID=130081 RepID=Q8GUE1_GALSU|nr:phosphoribulokinase [Galdieria sulphuraria]